MRWQIKAAIQTAFSLVPGGEHLNFLAQTVAGSHSSELLYLEFARIRARIRSLKARFPFDNGTVVEIGTGWTGIGIIALALEGVGEIHSFDLVRHLRFPLAMRLLRAVVEAEAEYRDRAAPMLEARSLDELLLAANAHYCAPGDAATTGLADRSVDLVFSHDVLEHVTPDALERITAESARILRGRAYHGIGLHDHLSDADPSISGVHFLGLSPLAWRLVNNRISYHNRLRAPHYTDLFARHGGQIVHRDEIVTPRDIAALKDMQLRVHGELPHHELAITRLDVDVEFPRRHQVTT